MQNVRSTIFHIIDRDSVQRAALFRLLQGLGYHCEIYSSVDELIEYKPSSGVVLFHEYFEEETASQAISRLRNRAVSLSLVAFAETPQTQAVVEAIKSGAMNFLALPFDGVSLDRALKKLIAEDGSHQSLQASRTEAYLRIKSLSTREREVLYLIAEGCSNKEAGRQLGISPRTIEIHRMKMMSRLGVSSAAQAVRMKILAETVDVP